MVVEALEQLLELGLALGVLGDVAVDGAAGDEVLQLGRVGGLGCDRLAGVGLGDGKRARKSRVIVENVVSSTFNLLALPSNFP